MPIIMLPLNRRSLCINGRRSVLLATGNETRWPLLINNSFNGQFLTFETALLRLLILGYYCVHKIRQHNADDNCAHYTKTHNTIDEQSESIKCHVYWPSAMMNSHGSVYSNCIGRCTESTKQCRSTGSVINLKDYSKPTVPTTHRDNASVVDISRDADWVYGNKIVVAEVRGNRWDQRGNWMGVVSVCQAQIYRRQLMAD